MLFFKFKMKPKQEDFVLKKLEDIWKKRHETEFFDTERQMVDFLEYLDRHSRTGSMLLDSYLSDHMAKCYMEVLKYFPENKEAKQYIHAHALSRVA